MNAHFTTEEESKLRKARSSAYVREVSISDGARDIPQFDTLANLIIGLLDRIDGEWIVDIGMSGGVFLSRTIPRFGATRKYYSSEISDVRYRHAHAAISEAQCNTELCDARSLTVVWEQRESPIFTTEGIETCMSTKSISDESIRAEGAERKAGVSAVIAALTPNLLHPSHWSYSVDNLSKIILPGGAIVVIALTSSLTSLGEVLFPTLEFSHFRAFKGPAPKDIAMLRDEDELLYPIRCAGFDVEPFWRSLCLGAWIGIKR